MLFLVALFVFTGIYVPLWWVLRMKGSPYLPARGLVLSASQAATEGLDPYGRRCTTRLMSVEVDPIDAETYQVLLKVPVPTLCDALPGATLDLLIQRGNTNNVIVVGPLGSRHWIRSVPLLPQLPPTIEQGMTPKAIVAIPLLVAGSAALVALLLMNIGDG